MSIGFPNIRSIAPGPAEMLGETRVFEGDGSIMLPVPGLKELLGVRLGQRPMPMKEQRTWPLDPSHEQKVTVPLDLFLLDHLPDGSPVLLRNLCSNDSIFQSFEPFYITGVWDDAVEAPAVPAPVREKPKKGTR